MRTKYGLHRWEGLFVPISPRLTAVFFFADPCGADDFVASLPSGVHWAVPIVRTKSFGAEVRIGHVPERDVEIELWQCAARCGGVEASNALTKPPWVDLRWADHPWADHRTVVGSVKRKDSVEQRHIGALKGGTDPKSRRMSPHRWGDDRVLRQAAWLIPRESRDAILGDIVEDEHDARSRGDAGWKIWRDKLWSLINAIGQHIPHWLAWLGGVITGWLFPGTP